MDFIEKFQARHPEATEEQKEKALALDKRLRAIDIEVKKYRSKDKENRKELYWYLIDRGFTNDEIWIYSPHIGGDVGADEPDWV